MRDHDRQSTCRVRRQGAECTAGSGAICSPVFHDHPGGDTVKRTARKISQTKRPKGKATCSLLVGINSTCTAVDAIAHLVLASWMGYGRTYNVASGKLGMCELQTRSC